MMGNKPYPATPTGKDLRQNREELLGGAGKEGEHKLKRRRGHAGGPSSFRFRDTWHPRFLRYRDLAARYVTNQMWARMAYIGESEM
jgi:hypothetical protein